MYKSILVRYLELKYNKEITNLLYDDYFNTDTSMRTLALKYGITLKSVQKLINRYQIPKYKLNLKEIDEND